MSLLSSAVATLELDGRIAVLVVNYPPVNALGLQVREAVVQSLAAVAADDSIDALLIRCDGRTYFAGADIREFGKPRMPPHLPDVIGEVERCPKPVITAIHGSALGGGLELAMACHFRLATPTAKLGLPEVTLGILPGAGGTQRLPRLIGVGKALDMLTSGLPIGATEALERGLIDAIIDGDIAQQAVAFARSIVSEGRPIRRTRDRNEKLVDVRGTPAIIDRFELENAGKFRNLDAPPAILKAVRGVLYADFDEGIALERAQFLTLRDGPQAAALRHSFFAEREAAKIPGLSASVHPRPINTIGIVGAGQIGTAIANSFSNAGCSVHLVEKNGDGFDVLLDADLIIEAADEAMAVKQDIFMLLDRVAKPDAILATNTSSLDIDEIAAVTTRPELVLGLHFFSPANIVRLVEVVRGEKTSDMALVSAMAVAKRIGKTAVVAGNAPGLIGKRMFAILQRQAEAMILEGVNLDDIRRVAEDFGMSMEFCAGDLPGLNFRLIPEETTPDAVRGAVEDAEILARLQYPLINEGVRILQEQNALRASDIDIVWLKAYGWPAWTGGPMFYGDRMGLPSLVAALRRLNVEPAALLIQLAAEQKSFADFDTSLSKG